MATFHQELIAAGAPLLKKNQFYNLRRCGDAALLVIEDNNDRPTEVRVLVGPYGQTKKEAIRAVVAAAVRACATPRQER